MMSCQYMGCIRRWDGTATLLCWCCGRVGAHAFDARLTRCVPGRCRRYGGFPNGCCAQKHYFVVLLLPWIVLVAAARRAVHARDQ